MQTNKRIIMSILKIFIVEDDKVTAKMLSHYLSLNPDNDVEVFHSGKECLEHLQNPPDVICLDYQLPGEVGTEILEKIQSRHPDLPVIVVSAQKEVATAINLLKMGIHDYLVKDDNVKERLWHIINQIRVTDNLTHHINILQEEVERKYDFSSTIIGSSPVLLKVFPLIEKACQSEIAVSITGETGTGKEVVAKSIHYNSVRKNKPFIAVNVAAIPTDLIEAELFGHEKGSFTGAIGKRAGKFEEAQNGTIFLDEIGDMDLVMQVKLLRVLQEQQVVRIGSNDSIELNVRVIIATHKNLAEEVASGRFREDLYYRLLGLSILLPPLRERCNDVIILAKHFIEEYCKKHKIKIKKLSKEAVDKLMTYDFPGNIRELKAVIELAIVLSDNDTISDENIQVKYSQFFKELISKEMTLEEYNVEIIKHFLRRYDNKVLLVAEKLGIGKSSLYRMLSPKFNEENNG